MKISINLKKILMFGLVLVSEITKADILFDATGSDNFLPFGTDLLYYQQVYSSAGFDEPVEISGMSFKPAQDLGSSPFSNRQVNVIFDLSTTSVGPYSITSDLASNLGNDDKIVFSGSVVISSAGQNIFDIYFPFTSNFYYDPAMGNLLVGMYVTKKTLKYSPNGEEIHMSGVYG